MAKPHPRNVPSRHDAGFRMGEYDRPDVPDYVVVELRYEAPVAYTAAKFVASAAAEPQAHALNDTLAQFDIRRVRPQFALPAATVKGRVALAASLPPEPSSRMLTSRGAGTAFRESSFVQIVPKRDADAPKLAEALRRKSSVWQAYVAPRPEPAGRTGKDVGSRNFEPAQGYLHAAPDGICAMETWALKGALGKGVRICDIEAAWNLKHEDLPKGIPLLGGEMLDDVAWRDHGTAVLGEMVSVPGAQGTVGIAHQAKAAVQSAFIDGVFNLPAALVNVGDRLEPGDVVLIELHAEGPNGKYVAMQYWDDVFLAIQSVVAKGITVVEAAGNGDEDFELPSFGGSGLQKDSGAIVVGAGVPPTNHFDADGFPPTKPGYSSLGVPRSRIWFSNHGRIVDVQAWGWHVTTLGYGDAQGGKSENAWYTHRFSGTSSAAPIVTAAAAALQGRALAKHGAPLSPSRVRKILKATGTPQEPGPGVPLTQRIGPQPNLAKALAQV